MSYVNAPAVRRGQGEPLIHASHQPPVPASNPARYLVLCGRTVPGVTTVPWDRRGPGRLCPECVNETSRRAEDD